MIKQIIPADSRWVARFKDDSDEGFTDYPIVAWALCNDGDIDYVVGMTTVERTPLLADVTEEGGEFVDYLCTGGHDAS